MIQSWKSIVLCALCGLCGAYSTLAQTQQEVVAAVLIMEAGGEGVKGMEAVLEVVRNRAKAKQISDYQVVTKRFQFSCLNRISPKRLVQLAQVHRRWPAAVDLVSKKVQTNWTKGANHYHEISINPGWPNKTAQVGHHVFYRFN